MKKYILIISAIAIIASCKTTNTTKTPEPPIVCEKILLSYTKNIKPLMDEHCVGCHSGKSPAHGIDLSTFENVKNFAGRPYFLGSIKHEKGFDKMPAGKAKLDNATIKTIHCWVNNGMGN